MTQTLNEWFSNNYNILKNIAKQYTKDYSDLVSLYYIYLDKRGWVKISHLTDDELGRFSRKWLKSNSRWQNVEFEQMKVNNLPEYTWVEDLSYYPTDILIDSENSSDKIKEYIRDLSENFGDEGASKIILIKYHYENSLSDHERILFDLTFTEMLTTRGVAKRLRIPHTSTYIMIRDLNKKIIKLCLK